MAEPHYHHIRCKTESGVLVVTITAAQLQGDTLADELRQELIAAVEQAGAKKVVLDFERVVYLSSAAFRPLLSLRRKLQDKGGRFVLCNLSIPVAEIFQVTRLISTSQSTTAPFEKAPDVPAAIARLNEQS